MPYRRKYKKAPRRGRGRRMPMYRSLVPNRFKRHRNQITSAVFRNWEATTIGNVLGAPGTGSPVASHLAYALSDMNGCACYLQLFAQYRVRKIKYEFIPITGSKAITDSTKTAGAICPLFTTAINRVSTSFPQDEEQIFSMMSAQWAKAGTKHTRYFKPVCFDSVYRALPAGTNALNPEYDQWLSTNMSNVAQHGLSYVMGSAGDLPTDYYKYRIIVTMYCEFKNRRVNVDNVSVDSSYNNPAPVEGGGA